MLDNELTLSGFPETSLPKSSEYHRVGLTELVACHAIMSCLLGGSFCFLLHTEKYNFAMVVVYN